MSARSVRGITILLLATIAAGCTSPADTGKGAGSVSTGSRDPPAEQASSLTPAGSELSHDGVAVVVPEGWDGRVLFRDRAGGHWVLQLANFPLPDGDLNVPPAPPAGGEAVKSMAGNDVLVTVEPGPRGDILDGAVAIRNVDFFPAGSSLVPAKRALARRSFCTADRCLTVSAEFASREADVTLIASVNRVLGSLVVAPRQKRRPQAPPGWERWEDGVAGIAVAYPPGWRVLGHRLLTDLGDLKEVLALATFAAPSGVPCGPFPATALEKLGAEDALIVLTEVSGRASFFAPRPERFDPASGYATEAADCLRHAKALSDWLIGFEDGWRNFRAYAAVGGSASAATRRQVWAILDSLVIEPQRP